MNNKLMFLFAKQLEKNIGKIIKIIDDSYLVSSQSTPTNISNIFVENIAVTVNYLLLKEKWIINADAEMIPAVMNGDIARIRFLTQEQVIDIIFSSTPVFTKTLWLSILLYRARKFFNLKFNVDITAFSKIADTDLRAAVVLSTLKDAIVKNPEFGEDFLLEYLPANAYIIVENNSTISIEKMDVYDIKKMAFLISDIRLENKRLKLVYCANFEAELTVDELSEIEGDVQLTCKFFRKDGRKTLIV